MRRSIVALCFLLTGVALRSEAQDQIATSVDSKPKVFEVVSIKLNKTGTSSGGAQVLPNGEHFVNTTIANLIKGAYETYNDNQLVGLPSWAKSDGYDIEARVDADTAAEWKAQPGKKRWKQEQSMLQAMLAERCKLKAHFQTKDLPIYDLVIAKGGLKMKAFTPGEESAESVRTGKVTARGVAVSNLIHAIPNDGRLIVDRTGLGDKKFDFDLKWTPDDQMERGEAGPSLFTALEEQLGLKLVSSKAPEQILVIDHLERPSEN